MKILFLNQTFYPDVMATAQQLSDLAVALAKRGHEVTVITSRRAYDDPTKSFSPTESWRGIKIWRLATTSFGKRAKWRRAADFASFVGACCLRLLTLPRPDAVVALTSPPLISFIGAVYARLRGACFYYWVMDLNPDEAIAAGWLREDSLAARLLQWMSRYSFRHAEKIIALDRFMGARIEAKKIAPEKIAVIPPWSHDDAVRFDAEGREAFRRAHGLADNFVVMYSGNHSPCHPLDTLLEAAKRLAHRKDIVFCFVGGGSEWRKIKEKVESRKRSSEATPHPTLSPTEAERERGVENIQHPTSNIQHPTSDTKTPLTPSLSPSDGERVAARPGEGCGDIALSTLNRQPPLSHQRSSISNLPSTGQPSTDAPSTAPLLPAPCSLLENVLCLPYQPLSQLGASLSAADVHVVVMGEAFVGTIHPCKIYNVLAVGAPVLYIGPGPSHLSEVLDALESDVSGWVRHGDVDRCVTEIERMASQKRRGEPERYAEVAGRFSQRVLLPQLVGELERGTAVA